ncbi:MAG: hypothetical protein QG576_85 [Bacteroidota bacterium]|nr:hypothetical protein [Bacteroidota bacterium]
MGKWRILPLFIFFMSCKGVQQDTYLTPEKVSEYFKRVEAACDIDNGSLWGKNLYGPVMFIDRNSRKIYANSPDKEGLLKEKNEIFSGTYPKELLINNNAVRYGGTLFAMAPLPAEEDKYRIINRAIRGLFHSFQESTGYTSSGYNTINMDDKNARLWVKLEWKALRKALTSEGAEQEVAIRDALIFKGSNRELYSKYADDETKFENYEGLATFTSTLLATDTPEENKMRTLEFLDRIYRMQSYARSYGYISGALYANLLYQKGFDFSIIRSENVDLGEKVKELYNIKLPEVCRDVAGSLALNYEIDKIYEEEATREAETKERIHRQISTFTEKPVVYLELESPYFDFEPEDIHSLDTLGTLFTRIRISDNWGKLTVDKGGCLISGNLKILRITAKGFKEDKSRFGGEGWQLILDGNWELVQVDGNYFARKLIP